MPKLTPEMSETQMRQVFSKLRNSFAHCDIDWIDTRKQGPETTIGVLHDNYYWCLCEEWGAIIVYNSDGEFTGCSYSGFKMEMSMFELSLQIADMQASINELVKLNEINSKAAETE